MRELRELVPEVKEVEEVNEVKEKALGGAFVNGERLDWYDHRGYTPVF
jgi:hypothetical protein